MKKVKMVTRTFMHTTVKVMCLDVTTTQVSVQEFTIGGSYATDEDALKKLKSLYETDELKLVHVTEKFEEEVLIGMDEDTFMQYGTILPPRKDYSKHEEE